MLEGKNISIVISGPVFKKKDATGKEINVTKESCRIAREMFTDAEIIYSTWEGEDCRDFICDKVIYNIDPGANQGNVNRQICSRRGGILAATREYVLAIRSESYIVNSNFLNYIDRFCKHSSENSFLEHRVVIPASMPPSVELFHMGDWYYFGHRKDLMDLWDIPYVEDGEFNNNEWDIMYNPHRWLIVSFVSKYVKIRFRDKRTDINKANRELYEKVLAENFVITGVYEFGVESQKYPLTYKLKERLWEMYASITFNEWKALYNQYCSANEAINKTFYELFGTIVYRHGYNLYLKVRGCLGRLKRRIIRRKN